MKNIPKEFWIGYESKRNLNLFVVDFTKQNQKLMFERQLSTSTFFFTFPLGTANEYIPSEAATQVWYHFGIIRKIKIHSRPGIPGTEESREGINMLKGMELWFHGDPIVHSIGLEDGPGTIIDEFEVEENEHICLVKGFFHEYLYQLRFISNKGRVFKTTAEHFRGSSRGIEFSTAQYFNRTSPSHTMIPLEHMYLKGVCANQVRSSDGFIAMTRVQFCMGVIANSSVIFKKSNMQDLENRHDLVINTLQSLEY